jgi:hypothetical protein
MFPTKYLSDANINDLVAYLSVVRSEGKRQVTQAVRIANSCTSQDLTSSCLFRLRHWVFVHLCPS